MKALGLYTQDGEWEGLYIDGALIDEAHTLGEGKQAIYWLDVAHKYGVKSTDLKFRELNDKDNDNVMALGGLPHDTSDLVGEYS